MSIKSKVTQGDLRKAMNEAKKRAVTSVKKIESPLAKYTETGQLMCILCKSTVRSEAVWPVHLNSKAHKENIEKAKKSVISKESNARASSTKRPISPSIESPGNKKVKGILKNAAVEKTGSNLPSDFFDDSSNVVGATSWVSEKSEIPKVEKVREGGTREAQEARDESHAASLPEGFFDDPKMDAKVRNVDYKDPIEEEWDKFQKEIKEEAAQSAQIIADDQEEATTVRQLDEIEEQMRNWNRVMDFVKLKDQVRTSEKKNGLHRDSNIFLSVGRTLALTNRPAHVFRNFQQAKDSASIIESNHRLWVKLKKFRLKFFPEDLGSNENEKIERLSVLQLGN